MTVENITDSICVCPTCNTKLDRKSRYSEVNVYLYIDNFLNPELAKYIKDLKSSRKLNKTVMAALDQYKTQSIIDVNSILKAVSRIESVLEITSDKSAFLSIKKDLDLITASIS